MEVECQCGKKRIIWIQFEWSTYQILERIVLADFHLGFRADTRCILQLQKVKKGKS